MAPEPERGPAVDPYARAQELEARLVTGLDPREVHQQEGFERGAAVLARERTDGELLALVREEDGGLALAMMALEAYARRPPSAPRADRLLRAGADPARVTWPFVLRALDRLVPEGPLVVPALWALRTSAPSHEALAALRDWVSGRVARGETPDFTPLLDELADEFEAAARLGKRVGEALPVETREWLERKLRPYDHDDDEDDDDPPSAEGDDALAAFGRLWEKSEAAFDALVPLAPHEAAVERLAVALTSEPPRSALIVGEHGVGKTAVLRALAGWLAPDGWRFLEAGATDLNAGQVFVGQLEQRVQELVRAVAGRKVVWAALDLLPLLFTGSYKQNPRGLLDLVAPAIERADVRLVGELTPAGYERLVGLRPRFADVFEVVRIPPADDAEALGIARALLGDAQPDAAVLDEALLLARDYVSDQALPGSLVALLRHATRRRRRAQRDDGRALERRDLLDTVSELTGVPGALLDERETLDPREVRAFFERRVLGQPEAVDALLERVALLKAGLTDPGRPQGVLFFVGPTGTGKTELARALADYLYGSPDRLIRVDLSEYATWEAAPRLLEAGGQGTTGASLAAQVRRQPFSVVLLDEFEKAHPSVWDLFLQVFDNGRLTADDGGVADFRHAIVIATSNLGAAVAAEGLGFSGPPAFAAGTVERQVARTFRPELVNRFDRVVVFRPLSRAVMRGLLEKELREVLERRGLRHRAWAVEWDESAIEFLLERGFTPDLGARPVKRAVERHFLAPLAQSILARSHPAGDQFLFVRATDGRGLEVTFVDPEGGPAETAAPVAATGAPTLPAIALGGRGAPEELAVLRGAHEALAEVVAGDVWRQEKDGHLAEMQEPGFWESPARLLTLSAAERMDRIEAGLRGAGRLLARLERPVRAGRPVPADLVRRLAERLFLLQRAQESFREGQPEEAFLAVEGQGDATDWAQRLVGMYRGWARRRSMQLDVLQADSEDGGAQRWVVAVGGYAAWALLAHETGLHVLEEPGRDERVTRLQARVSVAAAAPEAFSPSRDGLPARARQALAATAPEHARVVRRYRERPSPLVRDAVRGWRTGRLDTVLAGDFDLVSD